jgi:hypothetical protein
MSWTPRGPRASVSSTSRWTESGGASRAEEKRPRAAPWTGPGRGRIRLTAPRGRSTSVADAYDGSLFSKSHRTGRRLVGAGATLAAAPPFLVAPYAAMGDIGAWPTIAVSAAAFVLLYAFRGRLFTAVDRAVYRRRFRKPETCILLEFAERVGASFTMRQWVICVPKRWRGFLADRPAAVAALTKIFLDEIERSLCAAAGLTSDADAPASARPRLGGVSFLHRFGSAFNHHVHLHACVTDGVFMPPADDARCDAPPAFVPARPINQADLAALTERVRRRVIRWFRMQRLLDAAAAADMLAWENSGFSVDASVRITLIDRDVPSSFQSLGHLLRYCARPPFALGRLSVGSWPPSSSAPACSA